MKAAGLAEDVLYYRGINPDFYKYTALLLSGVLCGLSGASLSFSIGAFVPNISAGRGWIALVAVYLGYRRPVGVILSCLLFASAESMSSLDAGGNGGSCNNNPFYPLSCDLAGSYSYFNYKK